MNLEETRTVLRVIQDTYSNFHVTSNTMIQTWQTLLSDVEAKQCQEALISYIRTDTSGFAPTVGQLIDHMSRLQAINEPSEMEAWSLVTKALRDSTYHAKDRFNELPVSVQKAVGSPDVLKEWGQTDLESVGTVIQSNFLKAYRTVCERQREFSKLPQSIQKLATSTTNRLEANNETS